MLLVPLSTASGQEAQSYCSQRLTTTTRLGRVGPETDEHLQTPQCIEDEVRSWLTALRAYVESVTVEKRS